MNDDPKIASLSEIAESHRKAFIELIETNPNSNAFEIQRLETVKAYYNVAIALRQEAEQYPDNYNLDRKDCIDNANLSVMKAKFYQEYKIPAHDEEKSIINSNDDSSQDSDSNQTYSLWDELNKISETTDNKFMEKPDPSVFGFKISHSFTSSQMGASESIKSEQSDSEDEYTWLSKEFYKPRIELAQNTNLTNSVECVNEEPYSPIALFNITGQAFNEKEFERNFTPLSPPR